MTEAERERIYREAIDKWGLTSQAFMVMEEVGEMLDKFGKAHRGRLKDKMEIITELADVTIMMEQWATYFGWEEFVQEKERKLVRLRDRLNKKEGND